MRTYTHTHFWSEEDLEPLRKQAEVLRDDYKKRIETNDYLPTELKEAAKIRIDNLDIAIKLMGDQAD